MTSVHPAEPRHVRRTAPLRIAMVRTGGGPAAVDDETVVAEVGRRMADHGHDVTVYGARSDRSGPLDLPGVRLVPIPGPSSRRLSSIGRTALSAAHLAAEQRQDVVLLFGPAGAALIPLLRSRGAAVALRLGERDHQEASGSGAERRRRHAERVGVRRADVLIAGSRSAAEYYEDEFGAVTETIVDGCRILTATPSDRVEELGLEPGRFLLTAAGDEPEGDLDTVLEGHHRSDSTLPLVVVRAQRPGGRGADAVAAAARRDGRIRALDAPLEPRLIDQLFAHTAAYLHGRSDGNDRLRLLRAMGAGTAVVCRDVVTNREVGGTAGFYFSSPAELTRFVEDVERYPFRFRDIGELMRERARDRHDWDQVTESYEALAAKLARGWSTRGTSTGRRLRPGA
ncbi:glycosyltransferase [Amnibacterium kyonggiense]